MNYIRTWMLIAMSLTMLVQAKQSEAQSAKRYISEELTVFMHSGPSRQYRIIGSIVSSTPLTVLQSSGSGEFVEIVDDQNRQGWVEAQYIQNDTPRSIALPQLKARLDAAEQRIELLESEKRELTSGLSLEQRENSEQSQALTDAQAKIRQLQEQLATRELDMKIRWLLNGGAMAAICILLGIVLTFLPKKKKKDFGWAN